MVAEVSISRHIPRKDSCTESQDCFECAEEKARLGGYVHCLGSTEVRLQFSWYIEPLLKGKSVFGGPGYWTTKL